MQFITTDQRIAVENFEIGLIYTVTFTSGSYFLGACIGIGRDYVMFQRTAPELIFSLTMAAAADVAIIEPLGNDIGKILEYTGSVPVSIKTDGSPLLDYLITGNTIQNGTPTPENPIIPQGCGVLDSGQYKIPISSANTTTPVYLGGVETTRKVKKLVLTGEEQFLPHQIIASWFQLFLNDIVINNLELCTHYKPSPSSAANMQNGEILVQKQTGANEGRIVIKDTAYTTADDFKSYLAAQYAAGTPVTIWYVLAESETGIVNEPLMKIGDYADTLSKSQAGVNVPTTDGLNIFDIDTTVKPSEVYLMYFSPLL